MQIIKGRTNNLTMARLCVDCGADISGMPPGQTRCERHQRQEMQAAPKVQSSLPARVEPMYGGQRRRQPVVTSAGQAYDEKASRYLFFGVVVTMLILVVLVSYPLLFPDPGPEPQKSPIRREEGGFGRSGRIPSTTSTIVRAVTERTIPAQPDVRRYADDIPKEDPSDYTDCQRLENPALRGPCYVDAAMANADLSLCDLTDGTDRTTCRKMVAKRMASKGVCSEPEKGDDRDLCYLSLSKALGDTRHCVHISNTMLRAECLSQPGPT